jgi:hypothetical protein
MATYTTYGDTLPGETIAPPAGISTNPGSPGTKYLTAVFDSARRNLTASDDAVIATLPAGAFVTNVFYEIMTVDGSSIGFQIGDATDPNGYVDVADASSTGFGFGNGAYLYTLHDTTVVSYTGPKVLAAAQTVKITPQSGDTLDTLKVRVTFEYATVV